MHACASPRLGRLGAGLSTWRPPSHTVLGHPRPLALPSGRRPGRLRLRLCTSRRPTLSPRGRARLRAPICPSPLPGGPRPRCAGAPRLLPLAPRLRKVFPPDQGDQAGRQRPLAQQHL